LSRARSISFGRHTECGAVVAVLFDGEEYLYSVADGSRIHGPAQDEPAINVVGLGDLIGRDALITGSAGGVVDVWDLAHHDRFVSLSLDDAITDLALVTDDDSPIVRLAVRTRARADYLLELVDS